MCLLDGMVCERLKLLLQREGGKKGQVDSRRRKIKIKDGAGVQVRGEVSKRLCWLLLQEIDQIPLVR